MFANLDLLSSVVCFYFSFIYFLCYYFFSTILVNKDGYIWILCPRLSIHGQLPAPIVNGGGNRFENCWISNCEGLVTLTLNRVILHTVVHHSSTSTYMPY